MKQVNVEVLSVYEHFISNINGLTNGLYKINVNGNIYTVFRNGDSWGVLSHYLREPVTKCMGLMRDDMIEVVEKAINDYQSVVESDVDDYEFKRCMR